MNYPKYSWQTAILHASLVFLFIYSSVSKWADLSSFRIALLKVSYLDIRWIDVITVSVPILETWTGGLLLFNKTRAIGRLLSFFLIILFSLHLVLLHRFSPGVPCSCGGLLPLFSFPQHLVFNSAVMGIILLAEWFDHQKVSRLA